MIGNEREDTFVRNHRWAAITTLRNDGSPSTSLVAYGVEDDTIVISVTADKLKARTIENDPRVTVCVVSNAEPFNYVTIEGDATIQRENVRPSTERVFENIGAAGYNSPEDLDTWIEEQERVIIRVQPRRVHGVIRSHAR